MHYFEQQMNCLFRFDLEEDSLLVGELEPLLNGYRTLNSILIEPARILVRVELNEGYRLLEDFIGFSIADKMAILEIIENQINEF